MKSKEYIRPIPADWWLRKRSYTLFMLRELTAVFMAGYAIFLLVLAYRASQGPHAFAAFVADLGSPLSILLHLATLGMTLYHTFTWFNLMPKVTVFWRGEERVSPALIVGGAWVAWAVVTAAIAGLAVQAWRG